MFHIALYMPRDLPTTLTGRGLHQNFNLAIHCPNLSRTEAICYQADPAAHTPAMLGRAVTRLSVSRPGPAARVPQSPAASPTFLHTSSVASKSSGPVPGIFTRAWQSYNVALATHPLLTKCLTSGVIAGLGDVGTQVLVEGGDLSWRRVGELVLMGTVLVGPMLHGWFHVLVRAFPGEGWRVVVKRVALDQLGFAPIAIAIILSFLVAVQGDAEHLKARLNSEYFTSLKMNYVLWPAAQGIIQAFVPFHLRVLAANGVSVFWNGFLSYVANSQRRSASAPLLTPADPEITA